MFYADKFKQAIRHEEHIGNRMYYWKRTANVDGCSVTLFVEPWHTKEDIREAKREARYNWDVVAIDIKKVIACFKEDEKEWKRSYRLILRKDI